MKDIHQVAVLTSSRRSKPTKLDLAHFFPKQMDHLPILQIITQITVIIQILYNFFHTYLCLAVAIKGQNSESCVEFKCVELKTTKFVLFVC